MADIPQGEFRFPKRLSVVFGIGSRRIVRQKIEEFGCSRVMLVTVPELVEKSNLISDLQDNLGTKLMIVFSGVKQHVPRPCVIEGVKRAIESKADLLISLGGSSTSDAAKGINLILSEGNFEYFFAKVDSVKHAPDHRFDKPKLPHIAIPTSLSGGEFTRNVGITDPISRRKEVFGDDSLTPGLVILDPEATIFTGPELWSSSAMKILSDCIDCLCSANRFPLVEALAFNSIQIINEHLKPSLTEPVNIGARAKLQHAAWMSMYGGFIGASLVAAYRHQIGAIYDVMHGVASTIMLPHVIKFNKNHIVDGLRHGAKALDIVPDKDGDNASAIVRRISELAEETRLPTRLRDVGVPRDGIPVIARAVIDDARILKSPRKIDSVKQVARVLEEAW